MAKDKLSKLYRRKWLNANVGSGYIIIDAELEKHWNDDKFPDDRTLSASVEIKDCNRQITLDFWANDMKEYKQRLTKIKGLIATLQELETFMKANPPKVDKKNNDDSERWPYLNSLTKAKEEETLELTEDMEVSETPAPEEGIVDLGIVTLTPTKRVLDSAKG